MVRQPQMTSLPDVTSRHATLVTSQVESHVTAAGSRAVKVPESPHSGARLGSALPVPDVPGINSQARSSPHPSALFRPCLRPSERVPAYQNRLQQVLSGRNGPGRARTVANRAGTALTVAVRTGLQLDSFRQSAQSRRRPPSGTVLRRPMWQAQTNDCRMTIAVTFRR